MKKVFLIIGLTLVALSVFAQVDSTIVSNATQTTFEFLQKGFPTWNWSLIALIFSILFAISETLPFVKKWESSNGILQTVFKSVANYFKAKK